MKTSCTHCKCQIVPFFSGETLPLLFFFWWEFYRVLHLVLKISYGPVHSGGSLSRCCGHCWRTTVSLIHGCYFRGGGARRHVWRASRQPGPVCRVRAGVQMCSFCRLRRGAPRLVCCVRAARKPCPFSRAVIGQDNSLPKWFRCLKLGLLLAGSHSAWDCRLFVAVVAAVFPSYQ